MKARQLTLALFLPTALTIGCSDSAGDRVPTESSGASFDEGRSDRNEGSGSRFRAIGTGSARMTRDREIRSNVVLNLEIDAGEFAGVVRDLRRVKLWQLDHQLNFSRAFVAPHTCGGGSPRVQLRIDANGDGKFEQAGVVPGGVDFVAHGHPAPFAGCPTAVPTGDPDGPSISTLLWQFENLTDENPRWEITPGTVGTPIGIPVFPFTRWDDFERIVSAAFPNHRVLQGSLVEDASPGTTYYDLITILDLTLGTLGQTEFDRRGHDDDDNDDNDD
jgi:hypothetical protein